MRFTRLLAFATWVVIALLAMAAFAAFSPGKELTEIGAPAPMEASRGGETAPTLPPIIGAASGRQAAFGFSQDMLSLAAPETTTTTQAPATTTTTVPLPTTTVAPTTTTTEATTTTVAAPPPRTYAPMPPDAVYALVAAYFRPQDVDKAVLVAWCESRYDPNATNPSSGAAGLFQHIPRYWADRSANAGVGGSHIYDPEPNAAVAAWLVYSNGGWKHWNASASCWANGSVVPPPTTTTTTTTLPPETTTTSTSPTTVPTTTSTTAAPTTTTTTAPGTTSTTTAP